MDMIALQVDLIRDEGKRNEMYTDSVGVPTIGIGHNLNNPISDHAVHVIFETDIREVLLDLDINLPWYRSMSDARQRAVANMCFNMGIAKLMEFHKALNALKSGAWEVAADEMLASKWAVQVGSRADRLAQMVRQG